MDNRSHILLRVAKRNYNNMIDKLQSLGVNHTRHTGNPEVIKVYTDKTSGWYGNSKAQYKLMHDVWVDKYVVKESTINEGREKWVLTNGDYKLFKVFRHGGMMTHIVKKNGREIKQYPPNMKPRVAIHKFNTEFGTNESVTEAKNTLYNYQNALRALLNTKYGKMGEKMFQSRPFMKMAEKHWKKGTTPEEFVSMAEGKVDGSLNEAIEPEDHVELRKLIRQEIASVFFDLFKKRAVWK